MSAGSERLIAIGDVHGCVHALEAILQQVVPVSSDHLVFLGDLIDQGRDSASVLDRILELRHQCQVTLIQGNHEEMLLAARGRESALRYWENCGGVATLNSYRFGASLADIPDDHWALLESCQSWLETDQFILTHAGYLPDRPMKDQEEYQLRWSLLVPEAMKPHCSGKTVIVGHTEQRNSEILDLGFLLCLDTACWRHGWLTAMDCDSGTCWQASRWGILREGAEPSHRQRVRHSQQSLSAVDTDKESLLKPA